MKKINHTFICSGCSKKVPPANKTCRNHCPWCFLSLHVDGDMPGDRSSDCGGLMIPIEYITANGKTKIQFECVVCKKRHWNKLANDDIEVDLPKQIGYRKAKTMMCC